MRVAINQSNKNNQAKNCRTSWMDRNWIFSAPMSGFKKLNLFAMILKALFVSQSTVIAQHADEQKTET